MLQNLVPMNSKTLHNNNMWTYHFNLTVSNIVFLCKIFNTWIFTLQSFPICSLSIKETTVISCIDVNDQTTCYNASSKYNNVTVNETSGSVISTMDLPPNYKFSTSIVFEYTSGQIFESTLITISKIFKTMHILLKQEQCFI